MNHPGLNPFVRSKLKLVEPLSLVKCEYDGWSQTYNLEYRASNSSAIAGLLDKNFKVGKPLVVNGKHVVVRSAVCTLTNSTVDEVTIRVEAVDFAAVLSQVLNRQESEQKDQPKAPVKSGVAPVIKGNFGGMKRRILR